VREHNQTDWDRGIQTDWDRGTQTDWDRGTQTDWDRGTQTDWDTQGLGGPGTSGGLWDSGPWTLGLGTRDCASAGGTAAVQ
jgi:hypothetical protein